MRTLQFALQACLAVVCWVSVSNFPHETVVSICKGDDEVDLNFYWVDQFECAGNLFTHPLCALGRKIRALRAWQLLFADIVIGSILIGINFG